MPNVPIEGLGEGGLIRDLAPWELQPNQVTRCENVRFQDGSLQSTRRLQPYPEGGDPYPYPDLSTPSWIHAWERVEAGDISVIVIGEYDQIGSPGLQSVKMSSNGGAWTDISNTLYPGGHEGTDWNSFTWGRAVCFNNGNEVPQYFDTSNITLVDLPNWDTHPGSVTTCRAIRPFKAYMIAMDITDDGVRQETLVEWSDVAEPTLPPPSWDWQDPTTVAGRNPMPPDTGKLIDGLALGDMFMIYAEFGAYAMTESGADSVFEFRRALPHGILSKNAVCSFQNFHFVIGQDRIYVHDGFTVRYPADRAIEESFFKTINNDTKRVQCVHYQRLNEIVILYETQESGRQLLVWNYSANAWTALSLGPLRCACYGPFQPTPGMTWSQITTEWDTDTSQWSDFSTEAIGQFLYFAAEDYIDADDTLYLARVFVADRTETWTNPGALSDEFAPYLGADAYAERTGLDLDELTKDVEAVKQVIRIAPQIDAVGEQVIQMRVGGQHVTNGPLAWGPWVTLNPSTGYKFDVRVTYRYLAWAIRCDSETWFRMHKMDIDVKAVGRR